jgi:hypothetical protein
MQAGIYLVTLTVTVEQGMSSIDQLTIRVKKSRG